MPVTKFPDPRRAPADGLLAIGGDLHPHSLQLAYSQGIFPWPMTLAEEPEPVLAWFCPDPRAILEFSRIHLPRSLKKGVARARHLPGFRLSFDEAFDQVLLECARTPRPGQSGTWISPEMVQAYSLFHRLGHAHSVEVWRNEELIGGIYGVEVQGAFSGESMFHKVSDASKIALLHLVEILSDRGVTWMDIQMMTPHLKALGAIEISRDEFLRKLSRTHALGLRPFEARS